MIDDWFFTIELPISIDEFHRLPQNRAYKYEYFDKRAVLSPRPKAYHAMLDLKSFEPPIALGPGAMRDEVIAIRPLAETDWDELPEVFAGAFHRVQPFASLDEDQQLLCAKNCLDETRSGKEGPIILPACHVATVDGDAHFVGGLLVTLMPLVDLSDYRGTRWRQKPPADAIEKKLGRPHLTWIFTGPWYAGHGIGSALLTAAARELRQLGFEELASTFLLGNDASALWHWRMGFRLLPYPGSMRVIRDQIRSEKSSEKP